MDPQVESPKAARTRAASHDRRGHRTDSGNEASSSGLHSAWVSNLCMNMDKALKQKILVVDDMAMNRRILGRMVAMLGYDVLEAENGQECLDTYHKEGQNLLCVFLDLKMPVLDGWETAQRLRRIESEGAAARLPIVACTSTHSDEMQDGQTAFDRAVASGMDEFLGKPLSFKIVCDVLAKYVPSFEHRRRPERQLSKKARVVVR